jgi:hypothetical protein
LLAENGAPARFRSSQINLGVNPLAMLAASRKSPSLLK